MYNDKTNASPCSWLARHKEEEQNRWKQLHVSVQPMHSFYVVMGHVNLFCMVLQINGIFGLPRFVRGQQTKKRWTNPSRICTGKRLHVVVQRIHPSYINIQHCTARSGRLISHRNILISRRFTAQTPPARAHTPPSR